jgi:hypothetical protein
MPDNVSVPGPSWTTEPLPVITLPNVCAVLWLKVTLPLPSISMLPVIDEPFC